MTANGKFHNIRHIFLPWWKYGKGFLFCNCLISVLLGPIAGFFSATLGQAVIEELQQSNSIGACVFIGFVYFLIAITCMMVKASVEDLYLRWKRQDIEGKIGIEIYKKACSTDYKSLDDPEYYDSYKLATEEYVEKSSEVVDYIFKFIEEMTKMIVYGTLISVHHFGLFILVFLCSIVAATAQIYWSSVSAKRSIKMVRQRRVIDYIRRLFFNKTSVADMRISNVKRSLLKHYTENIDDCVSVYKEFSRKEVLIDFLVSFAQYGTVLCVPIFAATVIISDGIAGIAVFSTLVASSMALKESLNAIGWWGSQINMGLSYFNNVVKFFDTESPIENTLEGASPADGPFDIEFENVFFKYSNSDFRLENLNLHIKPGEKIAIVGENGVGKSTITKLLLRLYDVDEGRIKINREDIQKYNITQLRSKIGVAFQDSSLYAMSVKENLCTYSLKEDSELMDALETVGLDIDIHNVVTKEFDEKGVVLSGGEEQKLCLARLLCGEFGLVILDEPSSALDPIAEFNLTKVMFDNIKSTTIMISHRLSTVVNADRIILISDGCILEEGNHKDLLSLKGKYAEMFEKQAAAYVKQY